MAITTKSLTSGKTGSMKQAQAAVDLLGQMEAIYAALVENVSSSYDTAHHSRMRDGHDDNLQEACSVWASAEDGLARFQKMVRG